MAMYANQHSGTIKKNIDKTGGKPFMQITIEDVQEAAKNLTPSALKLYLYFAQNQNDYDFCYSPKDFQNCYDVSESTAKRAKTELIEKGYIVYDKDNHFYFYANREDGAISLSEIRIQLDDMLKKLIELGLSQEEEKSYLDKAKQIHSISKDELDKIQRAKSLLKEMKQDYNKRRTANSYFDFL